jgi:hypothetical protein
VQPVDQDDPVTDPGWYPDPQDPRNLRWWDGSTWTGHVANPATAPAPATPAPAPGSPFGTPPSPAAPPPSSKKGWVVGVVAGVVILVVLLLVAPFVVYRSLGEEASPPSTSSSGSPTTTERGSTRDSGESGETGAPSELEEAAERAGIPVLDEEGSATHTHTLLHVVVDGDEVVVPSGIGIDSRRIAAVHTHEPFGVLHVESPHRNDVYTLGQFLTLWDVGDDDDALCETFVEGPCTVEIEVVAPSDRDLEEFESFGPMPDEPPIDSLGLDTELAQGAVIELRITSGEG